MKNIVLSFAFFITVIGCGKNNNISPPSVIISQELSDLERQALIALYNATDGPNWNKNTNWNTAASVSDWEGVTVTNGRVTILNLWVNNMTGTIPPEIGNLTELTNLQFAINNLSGVIPPELGNLIKLEQLSLNDNNFTGNLPSQLGNLELLWNLDIKNNNLEGAIPPEFENLNSLRRIYLDNNSLVGTVPAGMPDINTLEIFSIRKNMFNFSSLENIHDDLINKIGPNNYYYSPQKDVDSPISLEVQEGESITLTSPSLNSPNNIYLWNKDGIVMEGATTKDFTITNATAADAGVYSVGANNSIVVGLRLNREPITLQTN
jgi:Leucine-rich repeat (LRR) protein